MKKLVFFALVALLASCAPGKSNKQYRVDVYCDSCYVAISNEWRGAPDKHSPIKETPFSGIVIGNKSILFNRFDSPNSCVCKAQYIDYAGTGSIIIFIEEQDTLGREIDGETNYCH